MLENRPFRLCWTTQNARSVFRTEALEGGDAVFLATHSPITGFDVDGRDQGEFDDRTEQAVLATLSDSARQHAFAVVQGEPGSGKSHLIRWLSVNWPHRSDLKLLLRRSDGSLEGALRQLREKLGSEFEDLFQNLGVRQRASTQGRANNFLATLANSLHPEHYEENIGDEAWCGRHRPDLLFNHPLMRERWTAPLRIVELLEGAGGERNSASASFDLYDLADFNLDSLRRIKIELSNPGAKDLARHLEREIERMAPYREHRWTAEELAATKADEFPTSLALLAALNRRRNDSIQSVLGVSADGLKTLFRRVRQALRTKGMRLVLLLEDITSWEGLDDSLIDVLVFNAAAQGDDDEADVCPLISVVGVTPKYYDDLQANYRQRITHEVILGTSNGGAQDVAALRDPAERTAFVARYLAAVRAGPEALSAWRDDLRDASSLPPPNVCLSCPKQEPCFAVFGSSDDVGLFPFTEPAVGRFFEALKVDDKGQTWRTPRGLLQAVLNPVLEQADAIAADSFPGELIERSAFEESRASASAITGLLSRIIDAQVDEADQGRFRRLVTYWGEPDRADTRLVGSVPIFAGLSRALTEAFALPWVGGEPQAADAGPSPAEPFTLQPPSTQPLEPGPSEASSSPPSTPPGSGTPGPTAAAQPRTTGSGARAAPRPGTEMTPPRLRGRTPNEREEMRRDLQTWASGGQTAKGSLWNNELHALLMRLDPRRLGVGQALFERVVTAEMVKLQGTTTGGRDYLNIDRAEWVRDGLEAWLVPQYDKLTEADRAFHLRNLALLMRRLEAQASAYVRRRLPLTPTGEIWSPVPVLAQVLLARAWLRGAATPGAPLALQLRGVLSDEPPASTDPKSRSVPWQEWLDKTNPWQSRLREDLRDLVALPTEQGTRGMIDAGELVGAIRRMDATGLIDATPEFAGRWPNPLAAVAEAQGLANHWNEKRSSIVAIEFKQLRDRSAHIATKLRGRSVADHLARADRAISEASIVLPSRATDLVQAWKTAFTAAQAKSIGFDDIEDLIIALETTSWPDDPPQRLAWLASRPAGAVEAMRNLVQAGEAAIEALRAHASDVVGDTASGSLPALIKAVGQALREASSRGDAGRDAA